MEELLSILYRWRRQIIILCGIAAIGSAIISLVVPEIYTSKVTFMVANPYMMERGSLFQRQAGETPVYLFGGEYEMNRLISLSQSRTLQDYVIQKFNLYAHYEIDTTDEYKDYNVREALESHFSILKTPEGMLLAQVEDKDKHFAADLANGIVKKLDEINYDLNTQKKHDLTKVYEQQLEAKQITFLQLKDSLLQMVKNNPRDTVSSKLLSSMVKDALGEYNNIKGIYADHQASLQNKVSTLYIVETATPAIRRTSPVRWLMVVSSTLLAFFAGVLGVLLLERYKSFRLNLAKEQ
ncbi:MAG: hypothetical protein JNM36_19050 [Chitinophagales bacterium]|nr:hypothetical protein [Chitinophagales bacterium]